MSPGIIIVLNGVSSAGKSSLARALQERMEQPLFHLSLDTFEEMLPAKFLDDDLPREQRLANFLWVLQVMHASARAMSAAGHHVVIDTVFERREWLADCVRQLDGLPVLHVGVHCPPAELERRERERGDRRIGQAVEQLGWVHKHGVYDLQVDTHLQGLEECARLILAAAATAGRYDANRRMASGLT